MGQEKRVFLKVAGGNFTGKGGHSGLMSIGDQGEEFPIEEEAILGMDLVDPSLSQVGSTDVETHREAFDDHRSDLQGLSFSPYRKGQGVLDSSLDVVVGAFSSGSYPGDMVGFEVVLVQA